MIKSYKHLYYLMSLAISALAFLVGCGSEYSIKTISIEEAADLIQEQHGNVVLLEFYMSTCSHCVNQMPEIQALVEDEKNQTVVFIGLSLDDDLSQLDWYARNHEMPFPLRVLQDTTLVDLKQNMEPFGIEIGDSFGIPFLVVLGKDGKKIDQWTGFTEHAEIQAAIDQGL